MIRAVPTVIAVPVLAIALALAAGGVFLAMRARWQTVAAGTAVQRGHAIAARMGCFGCHGDGGGRPIPNPGAKGGEVPAWPGGTWMMWNRDERDIRAWIANGRSEHREPDAGALIEMPAYGKRLTARELDDLVAYVLAVSHFGPLPDDASAGHEAAFKLGCFGCHGDEGRGLVMNPGSFKGYIPPWDGADYADLVRDEAELAQWVRNGACDRLLGNPVAKRLLETQAVRMPAYGDRVSDADLKAIGAYVAWVREHPRGAP